MKNSIQLKQQPKVGEMLIVDRNSKVSTNPAQQCLFRAMKIQDLMNLDIQWGTLLIWDKRKKVYDPFWGYHAWNINDDDTIIYDHLEMIEMGINHFNYLTNPIEDWKIKLVDVSHIKNTTTYGDERSFKLLDGISKNYKGYDAIYLVGLGWCFDQQPMTWDMVNEVIENGI